MRCRQPLGLVLALLLTSCEAERVDRPSEEGRAADTALAAQAPTVRLVAASSAFSPRDYGGFERTRSFVVQVQNLAYEKSVVVHHARRDGTWGDFALQYAGAAARGTELWQGVRRVVGDGPELDDDFAGPFAVRLEVAGQTIWDNAEGRDHFLADDDRYLDRSVQVRVWEAGLAYPSFAGKLWTRGEGGRAEVVFSVDGWASQETIAATPDGAASPQGVVLWRWWHFVGWAKHVSYFVRWEQDGQTFVDDNFGRRHEVTSR